MVYNFMIMWNAKPHDDMGFATCGDGANNFI